jgi:hypothetical protein
MSNEIEHQSIISTDLAGQEIREGLLQTSETRILVVEFNNFFEAYPAERLGYGFGILNRAGNFRSQEIVLDPDHNGPRLVIQPFRLP